MKFAMNVITYIEDDLQSASGLANIVSFFCMDGFMYFVNIVYTFIFLK